MIGATINETLRLMPPIINIPKIVRATPQPLTFERKTVTVPADTIIHLSAVGAQRNPQYWPHVASNLTTKTHDFDDWVPERWLLSSKSPKPKPQRHPEEKEEEAEAKKRIQREHHDLRQCNQWYQPTRYSHKRLIYTFLRRRKSMSRKTICTSRIDRYSSSYIQGVQSRAECQ